VKCGNRSNTHLNNVGFKNVIEKFKEKTGMQYTRMQFKNKWSKLKPSILVGRHCVCKQVLVGMR
jgi:hypothetical protein